MSFPKPVGARVITVPSDESRAMEKKAMQLFTRARTGLMLDEPFFGALAIRLTPVIDWRHSTLWTNGTYLGINPFYFTEVLDDAKQKAAVGHEVMHCAMGHPWRLGLRNHKKFNVACDYAINPVLKDAGFTLGEGWLFKAEWAGKSAEEIYSLLPDQPEGEGDEGDLRAAEEKNAAEDEAEWRVAVGQAALAARMAGKLPDSLDRLVGKIARGKVDWRPLLRRFVQNSSPTDYSWLLPNPRYQALGVYLPKLHSDAMPPIVTELDTSGSIGGDELNAFVNEVESIRQEMRPEMTHVLWTDAEVAHVQQILPEDPFIPEPKGGGGTNMAAGFDWVAKNGVEPACMVVLTDGHTPWGEPPPYPVLWVITTDQVPPWGEHVRLEL